MAFLFLVLFGTSCQRNNEKSGKQGTPKQTRGENNHKSCTAISLWRNGSGTLCRVCPSAGSVRRRPSNKAHLDFKGCLGSPAAATATAATAAEWSQFNRQHKNLSSISLSHSYYSAEGGASSIKHFHFIFFFFLLRQKRDERLLWSPTEKRWSSQNQKQITQRIEQKGGEGCLLVWRTAARTADKKPFCSYCRTHKTNIARRV